MELYERLGWTGPGRNMVRTLANSLDFVRTADTTPPRPDLVPFLKADVATTRCNVAMAYYLMGDREQAAKFAREALERGREYFFGSWRSELPNPEGKAVPDWWKANLDWAHILRELVLWGAYLGDWEILGELARYPDPTCSMHDADYSRADFAFFLALAAALRGDGRETCGGYLEKALVARKKTTATAASALGELLRGDPTAFQAAFDGVLAVHRKKFSRRLFTELISVEGSILYHMARRRDLDPSVAGKDRDYLVADGSALGTNAP